MSKFGFFTLFLLFASLHSSQSADVKFECTFATVLHLYYDYTYTCTLRNNPKIYKPNEIITEVTKPTSKGKTIEDVRIFYAAAKLIRYIPKNLNVLFPNLFGMRFDNTQLEYITKEDFKPFPKLRMFMSYANNIELLEKDLFKYNPDLEFVNFRLNKITYIDPKVFDSIGAKLEHFWMDGNSCGLRGASNNGDVLKQIAALKNSSCGNEDNAPPLYKFWLQIQEQGGETDCETKLKESEESCDAALVELYELYKCNDPCINAAEIENPRLKRFLGTH